MTPIEIFWGLAINWASSAVEGNFKTAFAQNTYLEQVTSIYNATLDEYEKKYPLTQKEQGKYPFYESQTFYQECLKFHFYEELDAHKIYNEIKRDNKIIATSKEEIKEFLDILNKSILANAEIKSVFLAENYQQEIFNISQEIQKIKEGLAQKSNSITINGDNNIVLQDLENIKELFISLEQSEINNTLKQKEKLKLYQAELAKEYEQLIWEEDKMSLKDTYIEQKFGIYRECYLDKNENRDTFISTEKSLHQFINDWIINKHIKGTEKIKIKNERLILILGQPGQGKSSFCKRLMYDVFYTQNLQQQTVFYISFRNITDTERLIANPLNTLMKFLIAKTDIEINKFFFRNSLLVLDGLDDLIVQGTIGKGEEEVFLIQLYKDIENYSNIRIIITSRHQVKKERFRNDFLILNFSLLTIEEEKEWLIKYSKFHPETFLNESMLDDFQKIIHLKELCEQPILLYMLAKVHTKENPINNNANRASIYNHLFTQIIERKWSREGQIDILEGITEEKMRTFLQEIGFAIFQSDKEYIHKSEIQKIISRNSDLKDINNLLMKDALKGLMTAFYIQETLKLETDNNKDEDQSSYGIEFMHKSLQEFLAAEKIWLECEKIIKKDSEDNFSNKNAECLKILYECFHLQFLSFNIINLLIEIIEHKEQSIKIELANRMKNILPFCIKHHFVYTYNITEIKPPIEASLNTFYGFWTILSNLENNKNYIIDSIKEQFCNLVVYIRKYKLDCKLVLINCKLVNTNLAYANLAYVNFNYSDLENSNLRYTNLEKANLSNANLTNADLSNANLTNADLSDANLNNTKLYNTDLSYAHLSSTYLMSDSLICIENITFEQLSQTKSLKNCIGIPFELEQELKEKCPHLFI